jgi:hypothetical protein
LRLRSIILNMEMNPLSSTQLLIIAPPDRLRENLVAMAVSVVEPTGVDIADNSQIALAKFGKNFPDLILVDFRNPDAGLDRDVKKIHHNNPKARIIFLQYVLPQEHRISGSDFRRVIYGDISGELLLQFVRENLPVNKNESSFSQNSFR